MLNARTELTLRAEVECELVKLNVEYYSECWVVKLVLAGIESVDFACKGIVVVVVPYKASRLQQEYNVVSTSLV